MISPRLVFDPLQHVLGLFAGAHQHHAFHGVVAIHVAEFAEARRDADLHAADVLHQYRRAVADREHGVADVIQRFDAAQAAHVGELAALRVEAAAGIAVVGRQRGLHLRDRQSRRGDLGRIEQHLVLHGAAAEAGIVGDARHRAVLRRDDPVVDGLEFHRRTVVALQHIAINQPRRRGLRRDRWRHPARQADVAEAVEHMLAREVVVGAVGESERDIGQAVQRDRALGGEFRNAVHRQLDRHGDQALDFLGRMSRPLRDDLDHRRRQVRIRIHRQAFERPPARAGQDRRQQHDEKALRERGRDDAVDQRRRAQLRPVRKRRLAHWVSMKRRKMAPCATILSPACSPSLTRLRSPSR